MTPEGRVKRDIKKLLETYGIWYYMPVSNGMGVVGIPDFVCCWGGVFIGIEAKAPGKRESGLTPNQKSRLNEINKSGGVALVIDDVEYLRQWLSARATILQKIAMVIYRWHGRPRDAEY